MASPRSRSRISPASSMPAGATSSALYLKTKNFHWHMSGPHFRDYHLLLDEQATQIFAITRRYRRAGAQGGRHDHPLHRAHRPPAAHHRQRPGVCARARHAAGTSRTTTRLWWRACASAHEVASQGQRLRHHQPDRSLDRRGRTPRMVPVRSHALTSANLLFPCQTWQRPPLAAFRLFPVQDPVLAAL